MRLRGGGDFSDTEEMLPKSEKTGEEQKGRSGRKARRSLAADGKEEADAAEDCGNNSQSEER